MKKILYVLMTLMSIAGAIAQTPNYDGIIYVTPTGAGTHSGDSWANATSSIADAQSIAQAHNAVVWVAAGIYYGDTTSTSENAFTMVDGVNVYGGFAGNEPANYDLSLRDFQTMATPPEECCMGLFLSEPFGMVLLYKMVLLAVILQEECIFAMLTLIFVKSQIIMAVVKELEFMLYLLSSQIVLSTIIHQVYH